MKRVSAALVANLCLAMSASESNYFMGQINLADTIYQPNAFPIGVCSLTEVGVFSLSYGVYTCDTTEQVTFQSYGADSTCSSTPSGDPVTYIDTSIAEGELYSFNCAGENNYQVADTCTKAAVENVTAAADGGNAVCCQDQGSSVTALLNGGCLPYTTATGVCQPLLNTTYQPEIDENTGLPLYARTECDGVDSFVEAYVSSDCSGEIAFTSDAASVESCDYFSTLAFPPLGAADIYRLLTSCMADTIELTNATYCTPEPTVSPTADTMAPTGAPTMEPSAGGPTIEPTVANSDSEDSEEEGDSAAALCFTLSAIVSMMAFLF